MYDHLKRLFVTSLMLLLIVGLGSRIAIADDAPNLRISLIEVPESVHKGQEIYVHVRAINEGGAAKQGGISVSFPDNPPVVEIVSHDAPKATVYLTGEMIYSPAEDKTIPALYPLAETWYHGENVWHHRQEHFVRIKVLPSSPARSLRVYIRVAVKGYDDKFYINPQSSSIHDQQGYPVLTREVFIIIPTPTPTLTPTATPTPPPTSTPTDTPIPTPTPTPTDTPTPPPTLTPTYTSTPEPTSTPTYTSTPRPTSTPTDMPPPTATPTDTPPPTATPTDTPPPTATPTDTPPPTGETPGTSSAKDWVAPICLGGLGLAVITIIALVAYWRRRRKDEEPPKPPPDTTPPDKWRTRLRRPVGEIVEALAPGSLLESRYRIQSTLGEGGMSRVYLAEHTRLGIPVAIKENLQTGRKARAQFREEAQILASLFHPNLPRVIDHFIDPASGKQYLVMDYVEGEDLESMVKRQGPILEKTALAWIRQVLDATEHLHNQSPPVIHRDVKPGNIKITPKGRAVLVDFGIAKVYDPGASTLTGARAFTPGYAPPEQYGMRTTERSDIYALGATLYTMLTGRVPPEAPLRVADEERLVPPRRVVPTISSQTEATVLRAMELETSKRWGAISEFRGALEGRSTTRLQ